MAQCDVVVIGGGIVGLATARALLLEQPRRRLVLMEKEAHLAAHQTGRNSGVIHSGIYYRPGSLKAQTCRAGRQALIDYCRQRGVEYDLCGKVIVATDPSELPRLEELLRRGQANGVACALIDRAELGRLEPHAGGIAALRVDDAGIVDFPGVCSRLADDVRDMGGEVWTSARVTGLKRSPGGGAVVCSSRGELACRALVNCAGLHSDRVAMLAGVHPPARILPFKGEYFQLRPAARALVKNLIYPVPDPAFPFLGVHFTRMIDGSVECGPNAILALGREAYGKLDVNLRDLMDALRYRPLWSLMRRHWRMALAEWQRSLFKPAFVAALRRLIPEVRGSDLEPAPSGIRAQALAHDGRLVDDFLIVDAPGQVHVLNAPSPAATAALEIGRQIAARVAGAGSDSAVALQPAMAREARIG